jgi:DNA polymerase III subunit delta
MPVDLPPEEVLRRIKSGKPDPYYLFHGPSEFRLEKVLSHIRETLIPENARDFNQQIFYGDEVKTNIGEILDAARSYPFMSQKRLIIVRRLEDIPASALDGFDPYLDAPMETTCLIFLSLQPDFRKKFYKKIRESGRAVEFKALYDNEVVPWMVKMAKEIGLTIDVAACNYLQQIAGSQLRDLYSELEKLFICFGKGAVGLEEVRKIAAQSRSYTIFELVEQVSMKQGAAALVVVRRFLDEQGKDAVRGIIGMLVRQFRLLWQTQWILGRGGRVADVTRELKVHPFVAKKLDMQAKKWRSDDLERAFDVLYQADGWVKSGSEERLILEHVVVSLCGN